MGLGNCEWCGIRFERTNPEQKFCKRGHAKNANEYRAHPPEHHAPCPTPGKRSHPTVAEAIKAAGPGDAAGIYRIYRCMCGKYHHGHDTKASKKRRTRNPRGYRIYYRPTTTWSAP